MSAGSLGQADILHSVLLGVLLLGVLLLGVLLLAAAPAVAGEALSELGRRIYVDGILPDGTLLTATRFKENATASGAEAACINCHRRSGYGSIEGRFLVPPVAGAALFAPGAFAVPAASRQKRPPGIQVERFRARSAYNERKLRRALRDGIDPDGNPLRPLMARYDLDAYAVKALAAYLRQLSGAAAPGISGDTLHLGTVITPGVPPPQREALLEVLHAYAATRKSWGMNWQLHVWQLSGAPQEWEAQLDEQYRRQPVFALLSGAGMAEWQPVHRFCERRALACVLPSVELAPERDSDYYPLYFSSGLALEAQLLAHHLSAEPAPPQRLLQVVADASGERAAAALREALERNGSKIAVQQMTPEEYAAAPPAAGTAAVCWLRPPQIAALTAAVQTPASPIYLSALLAPPEELALPERWKQALRVVSMYDLLAEQRAQAVLLPWLARNGIAEDYLRLRGDAYAASDFLNKAITAVQMQTTGGIPGSLTRERLLEALESTLTVFRDDTAPYYWRLSLGPGQRLPVKGGALLHYAAPDATELTPFTARIVP
ncbi:MAG TPA: hypothetical protein VK149_02895 [Sideroxyarcus sp.]|nr:hypothetical protein [Sideroxyarcus sp.]